MSASDAVDSFFHQPIGAVAGGIAGAEADQGRRHRARQQDRQNGLGP